MSLEDKDDPPLRQGTVWRVPELDAAQRTHVGPAPAQAPSARRLVAVDDRAAPPLPSQPERSVVELEVVIPAYNEEARIGETLGALLAFLGEQAWSSAVVVVDNGSIDRTAEVVDRLAGSRVPVSVIGCADQGKGAAVRRGILSSRARFVGFCDADLSTPVETLGPVFALLERGHRVVIGSRRCAGAAYLTPQPLTRRVGGRLFRHLANRVCRGLADTQCGFKFFEARLGRDLLSRCESDGFAFDVELMALAQEAGVAVTEVPVAWSDAPGSTVRFADGLRAMRDVHALRGQLAERRRVETLGALEAELEPVGALPGAPEAPVAPVALAEAA